MEQAHIKQGLETLLKEFLCASGNGYLCLQIEYNARLSEDVKNYFRECIATVPYYDSGFETYIFHNGRITQPPSEWSNNKFRIVLLQDLLADMKDGHEFNLYTILCRLERYKRDIPLLLERMDNLRREKI